MRLFLIFTRIAKLSSFIFLTPRNNSFGVAICDKLQALEIAFAKSNHLNVVYMHMMVLSFSHERL